MLKGGGPFGFLNKAAEPKPIPPPPPPPKRLMRPYMQEGLLVLAMAIITVVAKPDLAPAIGQEPTVGHVFYHGWVAALSTGLGALPLLLLGKVTDVWLGLSNALAGGMMLSASYHLIEEGLALDPDGSSLLGQAVGHPVRVAVGFLLGMAFVVGTKSWVEKHEDLKFGDLTGQDLRKVFLMVAVMTLHSFTEGLGIGVAFTGKDGADLGAFITLSLAMHNVPEGLAVALVLMPRGVSKFSTVLWSIFTSMPQPLIAVPVFMFARNFVFWRSVGLGFAAGSMIWVTCFELIADAIKELSIRTTAMTTVASFTAGTLLRMWLDIREGE